MLFNDADQEDPETSPDRPMASSRFTPLHKNRYGILSLSHIGHGAQ